MRLLNSAPCNAQTVHIIRFQVCGPGMSFSARRWVFFSSKPSLQLSALW
jgi:hypothetical protein